jgi:glycosyltransferase involved in cell wall biosynthesis
MRIGIDGRALEGQRAGIGRYVFEICRELHSLLPGAEFFVYARQAVELPVVSERWHRRVERSRWARTLKPIAWLKLRAGQLCKEDRLDVFWGCATLLPPLPKGVCRLSTVHDLTFRLAPETMASTHLIAQRLFFANDVRAAEHRLAISRGTAERLQAWLGGPRATVVTPGVSSVFRPLDPQQVERTLAELKVPGPYFLAVGTWEPRKNLELLIQVFRALRTEQEFREYHLVLAGSGGWRNKRLQDLLRRDSQDTHASILPLGFVPDEQLASLYAGSAAFVFPSRYEGFGMPVLEARACGARTVATDLPELREAGGDDTIYIEPTSLGLRDGMRQVITLPPAPIPDRTLLPTWRRSAQAVAVLMGVAPASPGQ